MLLLTRSYSFAAAHRLYNPTFSDEKNQTLFGLCNNPNGHGHNYEFEVTLKGEPHPDTGMIVDIVWLDALVEARLLTHVDHKHLNLDVPFFTGLIPSAENIAIVFWQQLAPELGELLYRIRVIESKNNMTEYTGG
jgi:6-pyruvoyltetrahydropterin/6-carboxytetrahydropterin synthase